MVSKTDLVNAEIPAFDTVEYRALLHITKVLFVFKRGLSSIIWSLMLFFPCPPVLRNQNMVTHWSVLCLLPSLLHETHGCSITAGISAWASAVVSGFGERSGKRWMWSEEEWTKTGLICLPDELYKCGSEPTDSEQQSSKFYFLCLLWKQHSQLESKTFSNVLCWVLLPRMFWVCLLLSAAFIQSGALPGTVTTQSPPCC